MPRGLRGAPSRRGGGDRTENTVGCRKYHAYSAMLAPTTHCPHTGPGGDGHCGVEEAGSGVTGNCVSYCTLFEAACKEALGEAYEGWGAACQGECSTMAGAAHDSHYSVASAEGGDMVSCRLLHVSRAFENPEECTALADGSACHVAAAGGPSAVKRAGRRFRGIRR